jgi:hypothetical protein
LKSPMAKCSLSNYDCLWSWGRRMLFAPK